MSGTPPSHEQIVEAVKLYFGPALLGILLSALGAGINLAQIVDYYQFCQKDARRIRILVALITVLILSGLGANVAFVYTTMISHYAEPNVVFARPVQAALVQFFNYPLIQFLVQSYFLHRLYVLIRAHRSFAIPFTIFIGILILGAFSLALACLGIVASGKGGLDVEDRHFGELFMAEQWSASAADIFICTVFVFKLIKLRGREEQGFFMPTNTIVAKVLRTTLSSTLLMCVLSSAVAVTGLLQPVNSTYNICISYLCQPAYIGSLLYTLSSRQGLRQTTGGAVHQHTTFPLEFTATTDGKDLRESDIQRDLLSPEAATRGRSSSSDVTGSDV